MNLAFQKEKGECINYEKADKVRCCFIYSSAAGRWCIYDEAKADFYNYVRSLDALKASMKGDNKTVILNEDSELARILSGSW